jgi:hypothetical protein
MTPETRSHVHLLSVFHYVLAGVSALFSLFPLLYVALGAAMLTGAFERGSRGPPPPPVFGWFMIVLGAAFMLMGATYVVLVVLAGRFLARTRHWTFCIVVAALSCAFFPFGTALGVFTIMVLSREDAKAAFRGGDGAGAGPRGDESSPSRRRA